MQRKKLIFVAIFAAVLVAVTGIHAADYVPGEIIVKLEHGVLDMPGVDEVPISQTTINSPELTNALQSLGTRSVEKVFKTEAAQAGLTYNDEREVYLFQIDPALEIKQVVKQLEELPGVIYAEPNGLPVFHSVNPPIDHDFDSPGYGQWGLDNPSTGWDINAPEAWAIESGDPAIRLAIIDLGLEPDHIYMSNGEFHNRVVAYYPDEYTVTEVTKPGNPITYLGIACTHGTMMTGIAAGATNDYQYGPWDGETDRHGIAGVAGGGYNGEAGVSLIASYAPSMVYMVEAIHTSVFDYGAKVINGSFSSSGRTTTLDNAITDAFAEDATLFFATANYSSKKHPRVDSVAYPAELAKYDICCAVGSIKSNGERPANSCYGPEISFVAPGNSIITTCVEDAGQNPVTGDSHYEITNGTSAATAFASGVGALLYSQAYENYLASGDPDDLLRDVDCKRIMEISARFNYDDYTPDTFTDRGAWNEEIGYGCIDAEAALRLLDEDHGFTHGTLTQYITSPYPTPEVQIVHFIREPLPNFCPGYYLCKVFDVSGGMNSPGGSFFVGAWGRLFDGKPGYSPDLDSNAALPCVITEKGHYYAILHTYVYELLAYKPNEQAQWTPLPENIWAPTDTSEIEIEYTYITASGSPGSPELGTTEDVSVLDPELAVVGSNLGPAVTVWYQLPITTEINISVYDVTGREVRTLVAGEQPAGKHELVWKGVDNTGREVSSGVYIVRMETDNYQANEKITLIR